MCVCVLPCGSMCVCKLHRCIRYIMLFVCVKEVLVYHFTQSDYKRLIEYVTEVQIGIWKKGFLWAGHVAPHEIL